MRAAAGARGAAVATPGDTLIREVPQGRGDKLHALKAGKLGVSGSLQAQGERGSIGGARRRIRAVEVALNGLVVGREDLVRALLLAAIAKEHVAVICPDRTARTSALVMALAQLLGARLCCCCLLTRSTRYDELFGPVDLPTLKRNWSQIVSCDLVFLDNIFDVGPVIASALSWLLRNRIVYDPLSGQTVEAQLWTAIGASADAPKDPDIRTLYDQFAIKAFIDRFPDERLAEAFGASPLEPSAEPLASMDDVRVLHDHAMTLLKSDSIEGLGRVRELCYAHALPLVGTLRIRGAVVSDHLMMERLLKLYGAYLSLYGATIDNVMNAPYDLVLYLARTEKELRDIKEVVDDVLGEVAELERELEKAKELLLAGNVRGAGEALRELLNCDVKRFERAPWLKSRAEAILSSARRYLELISRR